MFATLRKFLVIFSALLFVIAIFQLQSKSNTLAVPKCIEQCPCFSEERCTTKPPYSDYCEQCDPEGYKIPHSPSWLYCTGIQSQCRYWDGDSWEPSYCEYFCCNILICATK